MTSRFSLKPLGLAGALALAALITAGTASAASLQLTPSPRDFQGSDSFDSLILELTITPEDAALNLDLITVRVDFSEGMVTGRWGIFAAAGVQTGIDKDWDVGGASFEDADTFLTFAGVSVGRVIGTQPFPPFDPILRDYIQAGTYFLGSLTLFSNDTAGPFTEFDAKIESLEAKNVIDDGGVFGIWGQNVGDPLGHYSTGIPVPEPQTLVLLGASLAGLAFLRRRS